MSELIELNAMRKFTRTLRHYHSLSIGEFVAEKKKKKKQGVERARFNRERRNRVPRQQNLSDVKVGPVLCYHQASSSIRRHARSTPPRYIANQTCALSFMTSCSLDRNSHSQARRDERGDVKITASYSGASHVQ